LIARGTRPVEAGGVEGPACRHPTLAQPPARPRIWRRRLGALPPLPVPLTAAPWFDMGQLDLRVVQEPQVITIAVARLLA
jgi:hypothetical protein